MKLYLIALLLVTTAFPVSAETEAPATSPAAAPATETFTGEAAKIKANLEVLFDQSKNVNAKGAEKTKARSAIEGAFDWDRVAQMCIGKDEWKKQSESNRNQFKALLKEVIVKTAYTRLDTFWNNTDYKFTAIDVKGSSANAKVQFTVKGEPFVLEYGHEKKGSRWLLTDIAYDGEKYSEQISIQIGTFLKESNFASLLNKLKKRSAELDKPATPKKSG